MKKMNNENLLEKQTKILSVLTENIAILSVKIDRLEQTVREQNQRNIDSSKRIKGGVTWHGKAGLNQ